MFLSRAFVRAVVSCRTNLSEMSHHHTLTVLSFYLRIVAIKNNVRCD